MTGYTDCSCWNCFDIAIDDGDFDALCFECKDADCEGGGEICLRDENQDLGVL